MTIYERGETVHHTVETRNSATRVLEAADTMTISIYDPCGTAILTDAAMASSATGQYYYDYDISATAVYGEYRIVVTATKDGDKSIYPEHYIIMPWDSAERVRGLSGIGQDKSISDDDLSRLILDSYKEASQMCYGHEAMVKPRSCWSSCSGYNYCINGSNTTFFLKHTPLADWDGDGVVTGYGEQSCGTDIDGYYKDCDGWSHQVLITVQNTTDGRITVTKRDGSAIESTAKGVWFNYYYRSHAYTDALFRQAVEYLAAHKCILRFGELERASSADLTAAQNIKYVNPSRMWKQYKKLIRLIAVPTLGGVY